MDMPYCTMTSDYHSLTREAVVKLLEQRDAELKDKDAEIKIKDAELERKSRRILELERMVLAGAARNAFLRTQATGRVRFLTSSGPKRALWLRWKPFPSSRR